MIQYVVGKLVVGLQWDTSQNNVLPSIEDLVLCLKLRKKILLQNSFMAMALGQTVKSDCGSATDSLTYSHPSEI